MSNRWRTFSCCCALLMLSACNTPATEPAKPIAAEEAALRPEAIGPGATGAETAGFVDEGKMLAQACSGCHATPGGDGLTSLSGLSREALETLLLQYKKDTDGTSVMHRLARGYRDAEISRIAAYLGHDMRKTGSAEGIEGTKGTAEDG